MFPFLFPVTIRSHPVPLLIWYSLVIWLSHLPYLLSMQRDCACRSSVIPTSYTSPHTARISQCFMTKHCKKIEERDTLLFTIFFNKKDKYHTALFLSFLCQDMIWNYFLCWEYKIFNLFLLLVPCKTNKEKTTEIFPQQAFSIFCSEKLNQIILYSIKINV